MPSPSPTVSAAQPTPKTASSRSRRKLLIIVGAVLLLGLVALALIKAGSDRQPRLAGTDNIHPSEPAVSLGPGVRICQNVLVPAGTRAIELPIHEAPDPGVLQLAAYTPDGAQVARAPRDTRRAGWVRFDLDRTLDERSAQSISQICIRQDAGAPVVFRGSLAMREHLFKQGQLVDGAITMAYMRPGAESILEIVPVVAERIGRLREFIGGPARAILLVLCVLAGIGLAFTLLAGRLARRAALWCGCVAVLNAFAWALLTPSFQTPDEPFHTSYVQDLAVKGTAPRPDDPPQISPELIVVANAAQTGAINFNPFARPVWDPWQARAWQAQLDTGEDERNPGSNGNVVDYPPLYYASLVPAYAAGHALGSSTLGALTLMRLTSALYAGITVGLIFLLLLELFPGRRALAVAVALACAYQPVLTWISGGVNPDGALIALGTAMFYLFARGFRRGLTPRLGLALTLTMVAAYLVQIRSLGLGPGWALGMALLLWRRTPPGARWRTVLVSALPAAAVIAAYCVLNVVVWDRPLIPGGIESAATGAIAATPGEPTSGILSYLWQYAFPPVGSMTDFFGVPWTVKDMWVPQWVGKFGWYDYQFPNLINRAALGGYLVVAIAALAALVPRLRRIPTARLVTLVYLALAAGLIYAIARVAFPLRRSGTTIFEQARYVLPLISLYALALALAATWLRRWQRAVLTAFVAVCVVHLLFAFELTIQRYYL